MNENSPDNSHEPPDDIEHPSTLRITSKPFTESQQDAVERLSRWEQGETVPHVVNFQDASRLQRVLTPRRLELVESLMTEPAESIRDLADRLNRDVRQVHDDVQLLNEYRIVHLREVNGAKQPFVPYKTVRIEVELELSADEGEESTISA